MKAWKIMAAVTVALTVFVAMATPARAAEIHSGDYVIKGRVLTAWQEAGAEAAFGTPTAPERKVTISGRNYYYQPMENGMVAWGRTIGSVTTVYPADIPLKSVSNDRSLNRAGFRQGVLFRSGKVCSATADDRARMAFAFQGKGLLLDLRTSGTCSDPSIVGATKARVSIPSDADHAKYVTDASRRASWAKAFRLVLAQVESGGRVWIHCTEGKDRTGWFVLVLMAAHGESEADMRTEYMRSTEAKLSRLNTGFDTVDAKYGSWGAYLTDGLGLTQAELDRWQLAV